MTPADVAALVREDTRSLHDAQVSAYVSSLLITPPRPLLLAWDYGAVGETFEGFLLLDDPKSSTAIVYCQKGFGPSVPWGLISTKQESPPSMGMDSGWFPRFLDAFFESMASTYLDIWRVKERRPGQDPTWLSGELSWDEAWKRVMSLRESTPACRYDCETSIRY